MNSMKTPKGTELPLANLKGKDYLMVMHRIVWFREERSDWRIETDFRELNEKFAMARAVIRDSAGNIMATAHKREDAGHFGDYAEKAETGAIGRALALIGYGTQFAPDLDEEDRIVDSPAERRPAAQPMPSQASGEDPSEYVFDFGKFKGQKIGIIPGDQLSSYANWLANPKDGKEPSGKAMKVIGYIDAFLKQNSDIPF